MAIKSQADQRRPTVIRDQHGREYDASIEKASGYPTGLVIPRFSVPHPQLMPPMHFMVFDPDNIGHMTIDYDAWITDLEAEQKRWETRRVEMGHMMHPTAFKSDGPMPADVAIMVGNPPMDPRPVRAMQQGNRWALGFDAPRPPEADKFFPPAPAANDSLVFSGDTAPVFSEPTGLEQLPDAGVPGLSPASEGMTLAELMARLEKDCPAELRGAARSNWIVKQLHEAAKPQPQEA